MHVFTHLRDEAKNKTGLGIYPDGMVEHDMHVGQILKAIDELGIADNTIVMYATDNGAEVMSWPDGGTTPFRGEKNTQYEGAYRVPCVIRWPGVIKPGTIINEVCAHEDMLPTLVAAAGGGDVKANLLKGFKAGAKTFNVQPMETALHGTTGRKLRRVAGPLCDPAYTQTVHPARRPLRAGRRRGYRL